jgi:gliding motility-associatede transport system auxiliary component
MRRLRALFGSRRARSLMALSCIALMLVAANILAARLLPQRLDLTAEHLYTLSPGTLRTLAQIDEPITLRFYYSARLGEAIPAYGVYAQRVHELLDQYVAAANGKLRLEVHQPQPFSEDEDRAVALGLQGVPLNAQGERIYFGLAGTNSTDDQQTIPFFAPERERLLEYDLTRVVHALVFPKRTVVGLISSVPLDGGPATGLPGGGRLHPLAFLQQLRQLDDVETLPESLASIPFGTDVLMLVQPQNLPPRTLFAIDQFVLRGGRAIVFVDPYSELLAHSATGHAKSSADSNIALLFKAWGLKLLPDAVAADRHDARRVAVPTESGGEQAVDYVAWLDLRDGQLNRDDVITAGLRQITMASAGILQPLPGATTTMEPLITTSPDSMTLPVAKVAQELPDVTGLLTQFKPANIRYVLAAHITGPAATAFPDGPPKDGDQPAAAGDFVQQSAEPINVVVVADTDMLDDRFWARSQDFFGRQVVEPVADNGDFVANAVDVLAGGQDLVGLRSRGSSARPFELVEEIQREADDRYAAERAALERKLQQTQAKLRAYTTGEPADAGTALAPEQAKAVEEFRADLLTTRRQLRSVQAALRRDISALKMILEFCDIALVPILVAAAAIVLGLLRLRRWRRRHAAPA